MDAKDLRTDSTLSERNNDGKYGPSGTSIQCTKTKSYQDIGSSSSSKLDSPVARPCAVIGPDRVIPPSTTDAYVKKASVEPWPFLSNGYRRPPDYPSKIAEYQNQTRNISPRQTYQENMQRIMVPPTYSSVKVNEDFSQISDRSGSLPSKHSIKLNVVPDNKYCEVPYTINNTPNDQKSVRNIETCVSNMNPQYPQPAPQGWTPGCFSVRPQRGYGASELYQYPEYSNCAGPRHVPISRPQRTTQEEPGYVYPDPYYQDASIRYKPYPNVKDRYTQPRYEFIGNYSSPFYPAPVPPHKYDIHKSMSTHPYPAYTPLKGLESRMSEPIMDGYHRAIPPANYNLPFRNPVIHPPYGSIIANCPQGKLPSYLGESAPKMPVSNKPPYDANSNVYVEYENSRLKGYPASENVFTNEMRLHSINNQMVLPNYPSINVHSIPPHTYYKKDSLPIKNCEYANSMRNMDPLLNVMNPITHRLPHFSPGGIPISPTNSNASNDTTHTHSTLHEDCGYVSQTSGASIKSIDSAIYRNNEYYRRYYDPRYRPILRTSPMMPKQEYPSSNLGSKDKKQINVRQFLEMWNEGDDENDKNNTSKETIVHSISDSHPLSRSHDSRNNHEQLYVLGLVNVSSEDLSKYEHIQTVSKLPENIKGYNSIELLNQFEEVIESSNMNYYKANTSKENTMAVKPNFARQTPAMLSRSLSPLDVEAKISQSVIHKEVGCNFEIRPCSPKMLNVELAAPIQNVLNERAIEKVTNPLSSLVNTKSPIMKLDENMDTSNIIKNQNHIVIGEHIKTPSCKLANAQYPDSLESLKTNYSLQDLESNSGVCLASLPRLDNDIELNFPEVNQQFINANKSETVNMQSVVNDNAQFIMAGRNQVKDKKDTEYKLPNYIDEYEKQYPKLSKYRKNKGNGLESNDEGFLPTVIRTDSVIIKNPENIKNLEESAEHFPVVKLLDENQFSPMNLTSQCDKIEITQSDTIQNNAGTTDKKGSHNNEDKNSSADLAIDFSFHKNSDINYLQMDKESSNDIPAENNVTSPINNCEKNVLPTNKKQDTCLSSEFCEEEERSCTPSTLYNESIKSLIMKDKVPTRNSLNTTENVNCHISEEKTAEVSQALDVKVANKNEEIVITKCDTTKIDSEFSIPESFLTTNEKFDHKAHIQMSDILYSELEDFPKLKKINNEFNGEEHIKIEDNNSTNEICLIKKCVDTKANADTSETNKDSEMFLPVLETSEKEFISELPEFSKQNYAEKSYINESISQTAEISGTMIFQHDSILELGGGKIQDENEHSDDIIVNDKERDVAVGCEKEVISNLLITDTEKDSVDNTNDNEDGIQHRHPGMTYTMDFEQKSASGLKEICVEGPDIQCDGITTTSPVVYGVKSCPDRVFEPQQIQKESQSFQLIDKKVSLGQFKVPVDSDILNFNQEIKSEQKEIIMEGHCDQFSFKNKHHNEIDVSEVSNVVNLGKVVSDLKKMINDNDDKCSEDDTKWHRNEKCLIKQKHCVENKVNCNEKTLSLNSAGNENNIEHTVSFTETEKCPMNIKENVVHSEINYLSNIIEFTNLNKSFSESGMLHKEVSISDNVVKGATESIENTGQSTCHLDNPLDNSQAHNKDVLLSESGFSENVISQNNGIINEYIFSSNIKYEGNIQQLNNQSEISSAFKSLKNDDSMISLNSVDILQAVMSDGDSLHSCTPKLIVTNENNTPVECNYNFTREICFRKNLFSPYIQKLLTFSEGKYNSCNILLKSSFFDDGHEKGAVLLECGNSSFKTKNIGTEDQSYKNCTAKKSSNTDVSESSRLVDYDSSDYSLSPCAGSDFKLYSKSEQNVDYIEKLQESLEIENEEIEKSRKTSTIGDTDVGDININLNESKENDLISEKITLETEHEIISNIEFKDDDDDKEIIDIKYTNILELVEEVQDQNDEEKCAEKNVGDGVICELEEVSRHSLKRSLSDSALYSFSEDFKDKSTNNIPNTWTFKRKKLNDNLIKSNVVVENYNNVININRRYSISSTYTEENVSFCILIDNDCVIAEEDNDCGIAEEDSDCKMCYTEIPEDLISDSPNSSILNTDSVMEITPAEVQDNNICEYTESYVMECDQDKSTEAPWVEDVACVETIVSEDIAENIIISANSPDCTSDYEEPETICLHANEHTDIVKHIYGDKLCQNDAELVETLYNTPQMDVNKTLIHRESQGSEHCDRYYDRESLERVLSETNSQEGSPFSLSYNNEMVFCSISPHNTGYFPSPQSFQGYESPIDNNERDKDEGIVTKLKTIDHKTQDDTVHSCESSIDNVFSYSHCKESNDRLTSSSPEVSSTTSEEKSSSILLKITNFKGSIVSQISEYSSQKIDKKNCSKVTNDEFRSNNNLHSKKPLITKAAQKYIPPLKETIRDLKVKISLPQDSLKKFKQLKISKEELKQGPPNPGPLNISKKPKPKFEDVLKSIDEIQFKMHKEKSKKPKKSIPKVVIKKNLNGSHYASTKNKETFNPDLTGRKWQPWVFIEKNSFIDNMAIRKKTKAIFSHRKNTFVLAEKFYKYKSVNNETFFITQPTYSKPSSGQLKYTIRLKHSY
ncbi:hypothetical protein K1T71_002058 [Dendrolimus kikuchii]|uniref:Uncharacterized protein n=1 Tax=Dendrolimus kikuchii TaxID=765133 RepID=A0ACC1DFD2_9NEOP|nr:hypothetical protein K1T71_002058 [Dendrolimus kikuchii]